MTDTDAIQDIETLEGTAGAGANLQDTQADGLQTPAPETAQEAAMAATHAAPVTAAATERAPAAAHVFPALDAQTSMTESDIDMVMDIPVQLSVELGRTRLTIKNILQLGQGSVVELDGMAGEPMDICVNGYLIAQGEVVVVDDKYGIRVTDIITPTDRLHRIHHQR